MLLNVTGLSKRYGKGESSVLALKGLNFSVEEGTFTAIMGKSGCGKSTLLHSLSGLLEPNEGQIIINGQNLYKFSDRQRTHFRKEHIGFVFQFFNLFPELTVQENILLPLKINKMKQDDAYFQKLITELGIDSMLSRYPATLSGGQQQRVAIARALIHKPSIILADEPTGNLDEETTSSVLRILKSLQKEFEQTIILVTHDNDVAAIADRVIVLRDGLIDSDSRQV